MSRLILTTKQTELMNVIVRGNGPDDPPDLDEVLERVRYSTTKASLQFSIRALIKHGLVEKRGVEKRRGRHRVVLEATPIGAAMVGLSKKRSAIIESEEDTIMEESGL